MPECEHRRVGERDSGAVAAHTREFALCEKCEFFPVQCVCVCEAERVERVRVMVGGGGGDIGAAAGCSAGARIKHHGVRTSSICHLPRARFCYCEKGK
jgi:hypothetical protein